MEIQLYTKAMLSRKRSHPPLLTRKVTEEIFELFFHFFFEIQVENEVNYSRKMFYVFILCCFSFFPEIQEIKRPESDYSKVYFFGHFLTFPKSTKKAGCIRFEVIPRRQVVPLIGELPPGPESQFYHRACV